MTESLTNLCPAILFLSLWREAKSLDSYQRLTAITDNAAFNLAIEQALLHDAAETACQAIGHLLAICRSSTVEAERHGAILALMRAFDDLFYRIHPRCQFAPSSSTRGNKIPAWLADLRDHRLVSGEYAHDEEFRLIPRGPLTRRGRSETASNAESLADRFNALSVVPHQLSLDEKPVKIEHRVIETGTAKGVPASTTNGAEVVVFIPVAEAADDLQLTERKVAQQWFVDFRLAPALNAADIIMQALNSAGAADIAFAPELVVSETHAMELAIGMMGGKIKIPPRITIAGSGHTNASSAHAQHWNETRVFNSRGINLWQQRKLWPAGLTSDGAKAYGLSDPSPGLHMEDNAEGDILTVADVDGLGRCIVLICQDVKGQPLAGELVRQFQPDWVFMPILDAGVRPTRWAHQQAFALSEHSFARLMVASSTTLACKINPAVIAECGMAIGPKASDMDGVDGGRQFKAVASISGSTPGYAKLIWRDGVWETTCMDIRP